MRKKSQVDIISAILVITIALTLVSIAYFWGIPLIQKREASAIIERASKHFDRNNVNSLTRKIEYIARMGGEDTFTISMVFGLFIHALLVVDMAVKIILQKIIQFNSILSIRFLMLLLMLDGFHYAQYLLAI